MIIWVFVVYDKIKTYDVYDFITLGGSRFIYV